MTLVAEVPGGRSVPRVPTVSVVGGDPLVRAGVVAYLDGQATAVTPGADRAPGYDVGIALVDAVDDRAASLIASVAPGAGERLIVLATLLDAAGVAVAVRLGALGVLARAGLTREVLGRAVASVARGEAVVPPDLLGQLLGRARDVRADEPAPPDLSVVRVSDRERAVLRLLADGADTRQIARELRYSDRTVKTIIQDITRRFGLRNRAHAVAYAVRNGLA